MCMMLEEFHYQQTRAIAERTPCQLQCFPLMHRWKLQKYIKLPLRMSVG